MHLAQAPSHRFSWISSAASCKSAPVPLLVAGCPLPSAGMSSNCCSKLSRSDEYTMSIARKIGLLLQANLPRFLKLLDNVGLL